MLGVYNKEKLAQLVQMATGSYSINEFGRMTGISGSYVSRIINCKLTKAPSPEILIALAQEAFNGITYEVLMQAAGHMPDPENEQNAGSVYNNDILSGNVQNVQDLANPELQKKFEKMGFKIISLNNPNENTIHDLEKLLKVLRKANKKAKEQK